jgi:hypothetical protein
MPGPLSDGYVLVKNDVLAVDPTILGYMKHDSYFPAIEIGEVVRAGGIGTVVASKDPSVPEGTRVWGLLGWQTHCVARLGSIASGHTGTIGGVVPDSISSNNAALIYGAAPAVGYFGVKAVAKVTPADVVVVTGANGVA